MSAVRAATFELLLLHHPALLLVDELVRLVAVDPESSGKRDAIEAALGELVAAGVAHRLGSFVFATPCGGERAPLRGRVGRRGQFCVFRPYGTHGTVERET